MRSLIRLLAEKRRVVKLAFHLFLSGVVIALSLALFIYPAAVICTVAWDSQLRETGECRMTPRWFRAAAGRYVLWANDYIEMDYAESVDHQNVAATEWPMFGSVFLLLTAEELHKQGKIDATQGTAREAVDKAAEIVASPATATWVKAKWGDGYLKQQNVFYRMLLLLGLSSYESITDDTRYHALVSRQRAALAEELAAAKLHMREDYPGECYPSDVLWGVAAIQRAARLDGTNHDELAKNLMVALDGPLKTADGLPAFQVDAASGTILQDARGCGNSGILVFAGELDPEVAGRWYDAHAEGFWKDNGWMVGFTEAPRGSAGQLMDVDSGPVLWEFGAAASAFGIGAAKSVGRIDHAAPLTTEAVAFSWPTPFGPLVPGLMGRLAVKSWSLGEVALLFSMTRPTSAAETVPFEGPTPRIVWGLVAVYAGLGLLFIALEIRSCRRLLRRHRESRILREHLQGTPAGMA